MAPGAQLALATTSPAADVRAAGRDIALVPGRIAHVAVPPSADAVRIAVGNATLHLPVVDTSRAAAPYAGSPAPRFQLASLAGKTVQLSDFAGRGLIVNFWASYCVPCQHEFPLLVKTAATLPGSTRLISINYEETPAAIQNFLTKNHADLPLILLDQAGRAKDAYAVHALPTTFFIGPDGVVRLRVTGQLTEAVIQAGLQLIQSAPSGA